MAKNTTVDVPPALSYLHAGQYEAYLHDDDNNFICYRVEPGGALSRHAMWDIHSILKRLADCEARLDALTRRCAELEAR